MLIRRKGVQFEIKDADKGVVMAVFATLGVIDKDGDITLPGFFGEQEVVMLPAHDWKSVPIGKGTIREVGDKAIAELQMNLDIEEGRKWFSALKFDASHGKPLQQYSYGFTVVDGGSSDGGQDAAGQKAYRTLRSTPEGKPGCVVHEVSPVLVGAGEGTGTLAVKDAGLKFCDEVEAAVAAAEGTIHRAKSLADMRAKEGRGMSAANREKLSHLLARLKAAGDALAPLLSDDDDRKAARVELRRTLRLQTGI